MRVVNFNAGPSTLPLAVLEEVRDEIVEFADAGMSMVEVSHRSEAYGAVHESARNLVREHAEWALRRR